MRKSFKNKLMKKFSILSVLSTSLGMSLMAFCANGPDAILHNILKIAFGILAFGGIVNVVMGAVPIFKYMQDHDNVPPGGLNKAIGQLIVGIVLIFLNPIATLLLGQDPTTYSFFGV